MPCSMHTHHKKSRISFWLLLKILKVPYEFLIATIAFGMGVDCKGLHTVIHQQGLMITFKKQVGHVEMENRAMHFFLGRPKQKTFPKKWNVNLLIILCSSNILINSFGTASEPLAPKHICCDISQKLCECDACEIVCVFFIHLVSKEVEWC